MTKIKHLKDTSKPASVTSEELSKMKSTLSEYQTAKSRLAELSMSQYETCRFIEALESKMKKMDHDIVEKYNLQDKQFSIDPNNGNIVLK